MDWEEEGGNGRNNSEDDDEETKRRVAATAEKLTKWRLLDKSSFPGGIGIGPQVSISTPGVTATTIAIAAIINSNPTDLSVSSQHHRSIPSSHPHHLHSNLN